MSIVRFFLLSLITAPLWLVRLDAAPLTSSGAVSASPTIIIRSAAGRVVHSGYQVRGKPMDLWEVEVKLEHQDGSPWIPSRWDCLDFRAGAMRTLLSPDFKGRLKGYALGWSRTLERAPFAVEARTGQTECDEGCPKNWVADRWAWEEAPQGQLGGPGGIVWEGVAKLGELGPEVDPSGVRERSFSISTEGGVIRGQIGYITNGGALRLDDEVAAVARYEGGGPSAGFTVVFLGAGAKTLGTLTVTPESNRPFAFLRVEKGFEVFDSDVRTLVLEHSVNADAASEDLSSLKAPVTKRPVVRRSWLTGTTHD